MMASTFPALAAVAVSSVANSGLGRMLRPVAPSFRIRDERPRDEAAREALLDRSFGPGRFTKTCERLRENRLPADGLSFVALDGATVVGTLRFWHVECGRKIALMLGPLAVDPAYRSAGIGRALIEHGLQRAAKTRARQRDPGRRRALLRAVRLHDCAGGEACPARVRSTSRGSSASN